MPDQCPDCGTTENLETNGYAEGWRSCEACEIRWNLHIQRMNFLIAKLGPWKADELNNAGILPTIFAVEERGEGIDVPTIIFDDSRELADLLEKFAAGEFDPRKEVNP